MNLYEIDQKIMNCVDMETGEIIDTARLDELQMDRDTKIENIACWIKNLNADAEAFKTEKQSFADRQKAAENKAESLKKYLAGYLAGQKFSTPRVAISFRKTSSVNILNSQIQHQIKQQLKTQSKLEIVFPVQKSWKVRACQLNEQK